MNILAVGGKQRTPFNQTQAQFHVNEELTQYGNFVFDVGFNIIEEDTNKKETFHLNSIYRNTECNI